MTRLPTRRLHALVAGCSMLPLVTSCVAQQRAYRIGQDVPEPDARVLLRRLALDVPPDDLLGAPLPPGGRVARPSSAAPPFVAATTPGDSNRALECLTEAIYYEARSQGVDGGRAVAQVVLNRVRDRAFPRSVCGVVYQGSERRTGCQFSFTCDGSMNARRDQGSWDRARMVAAAALAGDVYTPVGSATHYHANYVLPWWASSLARVTQVGAHIFYRWRGAMENALAFRQRYAGAEPVVGVAVVAADAGGVTVRYGNRPAEGESASGVTVHRGVDVPGTAFTRASWVSGVRIHVGLAPHEDDGGEDVILSDET